MRPAVSKLVRPVTELITSVSKYKGGWRRLATLTPPHLCAMGTEPSSTRLPATQSAKAVVSVTAGSRSRRASASWLWATSAGGVVQGVGRTQENTAPGTCTPQGEYWARL